MKEEENGVSRAAWAHHKYVLAWGKWGCRVLVKQTGDAGGAIGRCRWWSRSLSQHTRRRPSPRFRRHRDVQEGLKTLECVILRSI